MTRKSYIIQMRLEYTGHLFSTKNGFITYSGLPTKLSSPMAVVSIYSRYIITVSTYSS